MEYVCEHCGCSYRPKRTDSRYCTHSCRQEAYVLRKALSKNNLSDLSGEETERLSVSTDKASVNEQGKNQQSEELPVRTDNLPVKEQEPNLKEKVLSVNENTETSVRTDNLSVNNREKNHGSDELSVKKNSEISVNSPLHPENKAEKEEEYREYLSNYLEELAEAINSRKQSQILYQFFSQKIAAAIWVSERYRCLLECLLAFSEMKEALTDDLKEVCNAFTDLIYSDHFKRLNIQYPYLDEIKKIRERLRKTCIQAGQLIFIKYRLSKEEKQNMILSRFELSQFIRKKPFAELNFKE